MLLLAKKKKLAGMHDNWPPWRSLQFFLVMMCSIMEKHSAS
jgi:hypothetical protein